MADKPCKTCANFDQIMVAGRRPTAHGWCAALSLYPAEGEPGRAAPPGARRVERGERPRPHVVEGAKIIPSCQLWRKA